MQTEFTSRIRVEWCKNHVAIWGKPIAAKEECLITLKIKLFYLTIETHSNMLAAKKTKEDVQHKSVLFTGTTKLPNSAFCISKTTKPISTNFALHIHYFTCQN